MLFRKKKLPITPKPFNRVFASRWMVEYSGTLPHCAKQGAAIAHQLFCARLDSKRKWMLLEEGIEVIGAGNATHVLWCICRLNKDRGNIRCLFRRYLDLSQVSGAEWQDWVAFKLTQHLHHKLLELDDFHFIIPCNNRREYFWCAEDEDFSSYWGTEIEGWLRGLIASLKKR